jgi:predicted nucleotidyltransferase component of viral defense system
MAYSKEEIIAEKMRALIQQQRKWPRPRDLYDLWFIFSQEREVYDWRRLHGLFAEKCRARQIKPDPSLLVSATLKNINERVWRRQLGMLMKEVPRFEDVWSDWVTFCKHRFRS